MKVSQAKTQSQLTNYWVAKKFRRNEKRALKLYKILEGTKTAERVRIDLNGISIGENDFSEAQKELNPHQLWKLKQALKYSL